MNHNTNKLPAYYTNIIKLLLIDTQVPTYYNFLLVLMAIIVSNDYYNIDIILILIQYTYFYNIIPLETSSWIQNNIRSVGYQIL